MSTQEAHQIDPRSIDRELQDRKIPRPWGTGGRGSEFYTYMDAALRERREIEEQERKEKEEERQHQTTLTAGSTT